MCVCINIHTYRFIYIHLLAQQVGPKIINTTKCSDYLKNATINTGPDTHHV